jgi:hypothetical protein
VVQDGLVNVSIGIFVCCLIVASSAIAHQLFKGMHRSEGLKAHINDCLLTFLDSRTRLSRERKSRV